jgi:2-hydroxychromene-2-carboxylate isomerase
VTALDRPAADTVYADFTCPACYLASLRVDRLLAAGLPVPDWRAVEHRSRLPITGLRLDTAARETRDRELDEVRALALPGEILPDHAPALLSHAGSSVAAYAEAYGAGVADLVRPLLFRAYWVDGLDIGDPEVLRRLLPAAFRGGRRTADAIRDFGYAVTSQRTPITHAAFSRVHRWQQDWLALGGAVALTLVTGFATLTGGRALNNLTAPAPVVAADAPSARRVPALAGRR